MVSPQKFRGTIIVSDICHVYFLMTHRVAASTRVTCHSRSQLLSCRPDTRSPHLHSQSDDSTRRSRNLQDTKVFPRADCPGLASVVCATCPPRPGASWSTPEGFMDSHLHFRHGDCWPQKDEADCPTLALTHLLLEND